MHTVQHFIDVLKYSALLQSRIITVIKMMPQRPHHAKLLFFFYDFTQIANIMQLGFLVITYLYTKTECNAVHVSPLYPHKQNMCLISWHPSAAQSISTLLSL